MIQLNFKGKPPKLLPIKEEGKKLKNTFNISQIHSQVLSVLKRFIRGYMGVIHRGFSGAFTLSFSQMLPYSTVSLQTIQIVTTYKKDDQPKLEQSQNQWQM